MYKSEHCKNRNSLLKDNVMSLYVKLYVRNYYQSRKSMDFSKCSLRKFYFEIVIFFNRKGVNTPSVYRTSIKSHPQSNPIINMTLISRNNNGGLYSNGRNFDDVKWAEITTQYDALLVLSKNGKCTIAELAKEAKISRGAAHKAILLYKSGKLYPQKQERKKEAIGSRLGLEEVHHSFLYSLFLQDPRRPRESYIQELQLSFGLFVSAAFITRWFYTIGNFKGTMRLTSLFPHAKQSDRVQYYRSQYEQFIRSVGDRRRLVFADEKPMKEIDIYGKVRRDPIDGTVAWIPCNPNAKNRYNILAAVGLKQPIACEALVLDCNADAYIFSKFVQHLISKGFLVAGDIFIVDNCSIQFQGENQHLQETLLTSYNILMLALPAYHPEYNPTEFVFNYLLQEMRRVSIRYRAMTKDEFQLELWNVLSNIPLQYVYKFYQKQGCLFQNWTGP